MSLAAPFVAGLLAQHLSPTWGYASRGPGRGPGARLRPRPAARAGALQRRPSGPPSLAAIRTGARVRGAPRAAARHQPLRDLLELRLLRPARDLGAAGAGPARPRSGAHGPRPVGLWRRPDPGRAGGADHLTPPAAARHPDLRTGRVGRGGRPVPGRSAYADGQRLCPRRRRLLPGGLRADAVADLPDDGAPARDAARPDGPGQRHGADGDLRRPPARRAGRRLRGGPGRPAERPAADRRWPSRCRRSRSCCHRWPGCGRCPPRPAPPMPPLDPQAPPSDLAAEVVA